VIHRTIALAAAGLVISGEHRDSFEQGGFTGAVLTGDDGDRSIETQLELVAQERQTERIGRSILNARRVEPDPRQIRRGHVDGAISLRTHASTP
jgi:hypothetical protein